MEKNIKIKHTFYIGLILVIGELIYFRDVLFTGHMMGISIDPLFLNMFMEHWFEFFFGKASLTTLRSFYPATDCFGYSDIMFLPGLVYSILRFIGITSFVAFNPALIIVHFWGVVILYKTLRELGGSYTISVMGVFFSLWPCSFIQLSYHIQFFSISTVPFFFLAVVCFYKNRDKGFDKRFYWAMFATISIGMTFLSASYIAYFVVFITGGALIIFVLFEPKKRFLFLVDLIRDNIKESILYLIIQIVWIAPLIYIYANGATI